MVVETRDSRLGEEDIQSRLATRENLKRHPRDDEVNAAILSRINRLYEMTTGNDREELGRMYAQFAGALDRQDPREITPLREALAKTLNKIDRFYVS